MIKSPPLFLSLAYILVLMLLVKSDLLAQNALTYNKIQKLNMNSNTTKDDVLKIATEAFAAFSHGNATGEWKDFLDLLTDDFVFWIPAPGKFQGENRGKKRAEEFCYFISIEQKARLHFFPPYSITQNDTTVVFEFEDEGTINNNKIKNRIVMSIDVRGNKVSTIREYVGIIPSQSKK